MRQVVWRVEDVLETGVYMSCNQFVLSARAKLIQERTPPPGQDRVLFSFWHKMSHKEKQIWFFGFASLSQFNQWFHTTEIRRLLTKGGMVLSQYKVEQADYHEGNTQVCFMRGEAELVQTRTPSYAD